MSQQLSEEKDLCDSSRETLKVTLLGGGWSSSAGGLATLNRELAIHLSQHPKVEVSFLVPDGHFTEEDKREAQSHGITVVGAKKRLGYEPLDWLGAPPEGHKMDVVVGHGAKLGRQVQFIKDFARFQNCKWVQVVHTAPEDLSKYKGYSDPISKGEKKHEVEVDLCKLANLVVPVGPRLGEAYTSYLQRCERDCFPVTPGLFDREFGGLKQSPNESAEFRVLLCGRGDEEDFDIKGYNIAAKTFADHRLQGKPYLLMFVGAAEGKQEEVRKRLLQYGVAEEQLTVRKFVQSRERMKDLLCEVNLAIMPSKSEGFGLVALEALSAGLPILVSSKSGFARALENIPLGDSCIVNSDEPEKWAEAIEDVRVRHRVRLQEIKLLRASYHEQYSWKEQCENFVDKLWTMVHGFPNDSVKIPKADPPIQEQSATASDVEKKVSGASEEKQSSKQSLPKERKPKTSGPVFDLDRLIRLMIRAVDLDDEEKEEMYEILAHNGQRYVKRHKLSGDVLEKGVEFFEYLTETLNLNLVYVVKSSLEIVLYCPTLESLEQLWSDYISGHLMEVAERLLVTDEIKRKLNLETVRFLTTIKKENYLMCRKVLMEMSECVNLVSLSNMTHTLDVTQDTQNGLRLNILLFNGGTERLRHLFDSRVSPSNLHQFLKAKEPDIKNLIRKHIINKSQKDKLYPPVGQPASRNFDISLLYTLLRNLCGLHAPATGWGIKPSPTDRSVEGAVEMIHCYRNIYGHPSTVEIDQKQFDSAWKDISEAMKVLGEDVTQIESLKEASFLPGNCVDRLAKFDFTTEVNYHASKHHRGTRQWVFSHVDKWFLDRGSDSRVLIITGNAGMGKSVIAAQICEAMRHRDLLGGLHFCQHNNQRRRKPELMLQSLAKHLCDSLPGFKDILTGQLASVSAKELARMNVEELFTHLLQEPTNMMDDPGKNILLVVDGLDECEYDGRNRLLGVIISQFHKLPSWIKFLVTGRPENAMAEKLAHLEPFVLCARDSNNEKDIELFFRDHLTSIFPDGDVTDNVPRFVKQADGLMLYAHYFIQFVEDHHDTLTPADVDDIFPRGIASVYEQYFERLETSLDVEDGPFRDFLASLAAARSPLPVTMASRILGLCLDSVDGDSRQIQMISGSISSLLPIRDACIDVFHKSIIDWLSSPELYGHHRFSVDVRRGDAVLSTECQKTYTAIENRRDVLAECTVEEKYALQHGIYHSIASGRGDESHKNKLFRYGCSLELLHAKLQSNVCDVFSVIEELQSIKQVLNLPQVDSLELDDCITCLRRHPYLLMENPKTIFQFLINEAETVAMSLEACSTMLQPKYKLPLRLELVNRDQSKDPVITKFRCKTNVNCCDVVNSLLVCGCKGGFLHMFSLKTGRELWCCQRDELDVWPEEERCNYCVIVPQHDAVIYGRFDYAVSFYGESIQLFPENNYTFIDSCVSQDRKRLVTRQTNLTADLLVWDLDNGNLMRRLSEVTKSITCCTISACGQFVISGSFDRGVSVWDIASPNFKSQHNALNDEQPFVIDCLAGLEGDSQFVLVNSSKKQSLTICELNIEAFDSSVTIHLPLGSAHRSLGVSSDGRRLYVCGDSQHISCSGIPFATRIVPISCATKWEYAKGVDSERVLLRNYDTVYMCHSLESTSSEVMIDRGVQAISFSVNGKHVYVLSKNGMSMYEASNGRLLFGNTTIAHGNTFALSPSGKDVLIQTKDNFEVYDYNLQHQWTLLEHPVVGHQTFFKYIDDDRVLCLSRKGEVQVWNLGCGNTTRGRTDNSNAPLSEC